MFFLVINIRLINTVLFLFFFYTPHTTLLKHNIHCLIFFFFKAVKKKKKKPKFFAQHLSASALFLKDSQTASCYGNRGNKSAQYYEHKRKQQPTRTTQILGLHSPNLHRHTLIMLQQTQNTYPIKPETKPSKDQMLTLAHLPKNRVGFRSIISKPCLSITQVRLKLSQT